MTTLVKQQEFGQTISIGAIRAFQEHYQMTDGDWIYQTPEYWYTSSIAKFLSLAHYVVSLEASAGDIREIANKGTPGRPSRHYRTNGKVDLTVWGIDDDEEYYPDALIEIKRAWSWDAENHGKDITRLTSALRETGKASGKGSISFGIFLIMTDVCGDSEQSTKKIVKKRFRSFDNHIRNFLGNDKSEFFVDSAFQYGNYYAGDESMPAVFTFRISLD